jgi:large subunit ribosomal protein L25
MKSFQLAGTKRPSTTKRTLKNFAMKAWFPASFMWNRKCAFSAPILDFKHLVYSPEAQTVNITVDGTTHEAIIQEVQFHPVTDKLLHIDFLAIHPEKYVVMDVPVKLTGSAEV